MRALSLFSGCGAFDLAAESAGIEVVGQCEIDKACTRVLRYWWPDVKRWGDVRGVTGESVRESIGTVDLIFGGPPCQPISVAGRRMAAGDNRNLWPEFIRAIREIRPRWVVAENPPGILSAQIFKGDERQWPKGEFFGEVVREITSLGYSVGWGVWGACDVGAPHKRERIFIVAYNNSVGRRPWRPGRHMGHRGRKATSGGTWKQLEDARSGRRRQARGLCELRGIQGKDRQGSSDQPLASSEVPGDVADAESRGLRHDCENGGPGNREIDAPGNASTPYGIMGNPEHYGLPPGADGGTDGKDVCQRPERQERPFEPTGTDTPGMLPGKLGDANGTGCEECDIAAISGKEGLIAGECARGGMGYAGCVGQRGGARREYGEELEDGHIYCGDGAQPGMGGDANGSAFVLDFTCWPAGRGAEQHPWEPPRVVPSGAVPERPARIKMLGNAVVPQQAFILFEAIVEMDERMQHGLSGFS